VSCRVVIGVEDKKEDKPRYRSYSDKRVYVNNLEAKNFVAVYTLHQIAFDKVETTQL